MIDSGDYVPTPADAPEYEPDEEFWDGMYRVADGKPLNLGDGFWEKLSEDAQAGGDATTVTLRMRQATVDYFDSLDDNLATMVKVLDAYAAAKAEKEPAE